MITDMTMTMEPGQCGLLLGANGAGKTTLLKILGGYHMIPKEMVSVLGAPPFHTTALTMSGDLSYIGGTWTVRLPALLILMFGSTEYYRCPPSFWSDLTNILGVRHSIGRT
jgi:energy-coupling factor transporter ATP-binding protein EcfA2